jgi:hypothetical protein
LHTIVLVRMRHDQRTRDYVARRTAEGLTKKDIIRCLKRFVAREVYQHLPCPHITTERLIQGLGQTRTTNPPTTAPICVHRLRNPALVGLR